MDGPRQQRIVAYLLLFRDRPQQRELLAAALWPDSAPQQSRKNLRQSIWQLQRAQAEPERSTVPLLLTQRDWVRIDMSRVWTDVALIDEVFDRVRLIKSARLTQDEVSDIRVAVELYRRDLLEGWSEPWCVRERERLRSVYVGLLEKLVDHCEASNQLADGITFAVRLLEYDRAHEGAHQKAMRLYHRAGDRVAALRQFEKCREALREELGVGPGHHTRALYEEIASS